MANWFWDKFERSDWFFLGRDRAILTVSMEMIIDCVFLSFFFFCSRKPANSTTLGQYSPVRPSRPVRVNYYIGWGFCDIENSKGRSKGWTKNKRKNWSLVLTFSLTGSSTKRANLIWLPGTLSVLDMIIILYRGFARQPCRMAGTIGYLILWGKKYIFLMQNIFIVPVILQHGCRAKPL